jgi:hypothetical protein
VDVLIQILFFETHYNYKLPGCWSQLVAESYSELNEKPDPELFLFSLISYMQYIKTITINKI